MVKLEISVTPEAVKAAFLKALKSINKEVLIPGFRKGKAPNDLVLSHYNKHVEDEWKDITLNTAFAEAIDLTQKNPYNKHAVKKPHVKSLSKDDGCQFTIEFETFPTVPTLDPANFQLPQIDKKEVSEEDVNDFIEQLRLRTAEWETVEGRGIEDGDYVDLDIESLDEPGLKICENTRFSITNKTAKWLRRLLLGATTGSQLEGVSEKDEQSQGCETGCTKDHHHEEFKPTRCLVTVKTIRKATLPEVNDEFAQKIKSESVKDLREGSRKRLEKDAEEEKNDKIKEKLKEQIEEKYNFDVPKSFLSSSDPEEAAQLRLFFIAKEFANAHNVSVTNNDVYQAAMHEVMTRGDLAEDLMNGDDRRIDSARTIIYTNLLIERSLNKLLELLTEKSAH